MSSTVRRRSIAVALPFLLLMFMPSVVDALERSSGDYWTYAVVFSVADVQVSGTLTYTFIGEEVLEVNGTYHDVSVMKVSGEFSGIASGPSYDTFLTGLFDGYRYESLGGIGIAGEDTALLVNISTGFDEFQLASSMEIRETVVYSEPLLSWFDPVNPDLNLEWNETVEAFSTSAYSDDSTEESDESTTMTTFNVSVASSDELLETDAGSFSSRRISITDDSELEILWYSEEIGGFVRLESYGSADDDPVFVAELVSYEYDRTGDGALLVLAATCVALSVAVLVVALVLAIRRGRGRTSADVAQSHSEASPEASEADENAGPPGSGAG